MKKDTVLAEKAETVSFIRAGGAHSGSLEGESQSFYKAYL